MATTNEIRVIVNSEVNKAMREMRKFHGELDRGRKVAGGFQKALKRGLGIAAAAFSVQQLSSAMRENVRLWEEQEQAVTKLAGALRSSGDRVGAYIGELKETASAIQSVTTVGDEASLQIMQLARSQGVAADQLGEVTKGAIGLSRAFGIDTRIAVRGIANAMQGQFTTLQRYIPALRNVEDEGEKLRIVQRAMAQGFEVAKAEADTSTGAMTQMQNAIGDLREQIGRGVASQFRPFAEWFTELASNAAAARQEMLDVQEILAGTSNLSDEEKRTRLLAEQADIMDSMERSGSGRQAGAGGGIIGANIGAGIENAQQARLEEINQEIDRLNGRLEVTNKYSEKHADEVARIQEQKAEEARTQQIIAQRQEALVAYNERLADLETERALGAMDNEELLREQQDAAAELYRSLADAGYTENLRNANGELQIGAQQMREAREEFERIEELLSGGINPAEIVGTAAGVVAERYGQIEEAYIEMFASERDQIERQKQEYIDLGVAKVDAEKWAAEQIRNLNLQTAQEVIGHFQTMFGHIQGIMGAMATLQQQEQQRVMAQYDERLEKLEEQHQRQLAYAEARGATEEELAEIKERQEEEKRKAEEEKEKAKKKAEKEAFRREKAMQLAQTTMAGAQAFVQALTAGPVAGPILASAVAAMTATQLSLIAQQQFPGLASGGIVPAQGEGGGLYRLGDKNKAETVLPFDIRQAGGMGASVNISGPINLYGAGGKDEFIADIHRSIRRGQQTGELTA